MSSNRIKSNEIQMGDSFLLPIEQSNLTRQQAKVRQILEDAEARAEQTIGIAENKAKIVTETANTEAERIIDDAKKRGEKEYDTIKNQAYQEGFEKGREDGLEKFKEDAKESIRALETLASSSFDLKKNIIDSATRDIVDLVSAIADKVCHKVFDDEILYKITLDAIKQLNDKENITIIVNPELVENINKLVPDFKDEIPKLQTLKILEDNSISVDGVIVETPEIRLDSRISAQIAEISEKMLTGADEDELEQE